MASLWTSLCILHLFGFSRVFVLGPIFLKFLNFRFWMELSVVFRVSSCATNIGSKTTVCWTLSISSGIELPFGLVCTVLLESCAGVACLISSFSFGCCPQWTQKLHLFEPPSPNNEPSCDLMIEIVSCSRSAERAVTLLTGFLSPRLSSDELESCSTCPIDNFEAGGSTESCRSTFDINSDLWWFNLLLVGGQPASFPFARANKLPKNFLP